MILPDFTPNNVEFQLMATSAWNQYYSVREFTLNQVILSKNRFSASCKETFLFSSNILRIWLINLEEDVKKYKYDKNLMDLNSLLQKNLDSLDQHFEDMANTMKEHPDSFDKGYTELFLKVFDAFRPHLLKKIRRSIKDDIENKFHQMVKFMSHLMEYFLHILYEMDYLYYNKNNTENYLPFLGIDHVDVNLYKDRNVSLVNQRLEVYKEFELVREKEYWTIKSYCSRQFLDSDYQNFELYTKLLSDIELQGIRISCIM